MSREKEALKTTASKGKDLGDSGTEPSKRSPVSPSSTMLDMHLTELGENAPDLSRCCRHCALYSCP
jgi:hypothetical protein